MKRHLVFSTLLAGVLLMAGAGRAQDPVTAAAEREQAEERYRTMNTRLTQLEEALQSYQKRMSDLRSENRKLRDEIDLLKNKGENATTQESIKHLAEKIEEVDKKRVSDSERTAKEFEKLAKLLLERPMRTPPKDSGTPSNKPPGDAPKGNGDARSGGKEAGWEYSIRPNDSLSGIVAALRTQQGWKTPPYQLQKQIRDANPGVNWDKLKIGQKIFIPEQPK